MCGGARVVPWSPGRVVGGPRVVQHGAVTDRNVLGGDLEPCGLDPVTGTDAALGRLYVLEGSTLGGVFIDRHLAALPRLAGLPRLHAFSPYGAETGAMWAAFRRQTRARVDAGPPHERGERLQPVAGARAPRSRRPTYGRWERTQ